MLSPLSLGSVKSGAVCPASSRADVRESCAAGVAGELMSDMIAPYRSSDVGRILRTFKIKKNVEVTDNGKIII